jgi:hypothetical protein
MQLTVEERVYILESYLKTMSYAHSRQIFFENFREQTARPKAVDEEYYSCHRRSR